MLKPLLLGCSTILIALPVKAEPVELQVFKALTASDDSVRCPDKVTVTQTSQPYREGGYTIDGSARLGWLAEGFTIAAQDDFSVTWVAKLKAPYSRCRATGGMITSGGKVYRGPSYLRLRFLNGKVYLILDMTGQRDANDYTSVITRKGVRDGNPVWSWSGSD